jgi:hypothetical protein
VAVVVHALVRQAGPAKAGGAGGRRVRDGRQRPRKAAAAPGGGVGVGAAVAFGVVVGGLVDKSQGIIIYA